MSITWITRSLQVKLIGMLAIMLALLGVTVALNFNAFSSLDGSAPALNHSGAQRQELEGQETIGRRRAISRSAYPYVPVP